MGASAGPVTTSSMALAVVVCLSGQVLASITLADLQTARANLPTAVDDVANDFDTLGYDIWDASVEYASVEGFSDLLTEMDEIYVDMNENFPEDLAAFDSDLGSLPDPPSQHDLDALDSRLDGLWDRVTDWEVHLADIRGRYEALMATVPEPGSLATWTALGAMGTLLRRRKRGRSSGHQAG